MPEQIMISAEILVMFLLTNNRIFLRRYCWKSQRNCRAQARRNTRGIQYASIQRLDRLSTLQYGSLGTVFAKIAKNRNSHTCYTYIHNAIYLLKVDPTTFRSLDKISRWTRYIFFLGKINFPFFNIISYSKEK